MTSNHDVKKSLTCSEKIELVRHDDSGLDGLKFRNHGVGVTKADGTHSSNITFYDNNNPLVKITASHQGSSTDSKGKLAFFVNHGDQTDPLNLNKVMELGDSTVVLASTNASHGELTSSTILQ